MGTVQRTPKCALQHWIRGTGPEPWRSISFLCLGLGACLNKAWNLVAVTFLGMGVISEVVLNLVPAPPPQDQLGWGYCPGPSKTDTNDLGGVDTENKLGSYGVVAPCLWVGKSPVRAPLGLGLGPGPTEIQVNPGWNPGQSGVQGWEGPARCRWSIRGDWRRGAGTGVTGPAFAASSSAASPACALTPHPSS